MSRQYKVELSAKERQELEEARAHHEKPYVRERAAGILKVASGLRMHDVALHGLVRERAEETLKAWIVRYKAKGLAGLQVEKGRGRKPAFSPSLQRRRGGKSA